MVDDGSGLSYVDREGNNVVGALNVASKGFYFILWSIILPLFILSNIWLAYRVYAKKPKNKLISLFGWVFNIFNWIVISVGTLIVGRLAFAFFI